MENKTKQTAAERYKEILAARRISYRAISPSGMEWELREISPRDYFLGNQLPFMVAQKVAEAIQKQGLSEIEAMAALPTNEQSAWISFLQKMVMEAVISPKIVDEVQGPNEIDFVLQEDFDWLIGQIMGGDAALAAANFRRESGSAALGSSDGKKRRNKA
jgi:hypothetical protein